MSRPASALRQAFLQPAALTLFFFGFISGLPFLLVGGTLSVWLKDSGVSLENIGLFSLAGLSYSLKFLWAPLIDQVRLPLLARLGQRRSWLFAAQSMLAVCLFTMSLLAPSDSVALFAGITALAAFAGATQDVIVDAYRIEIAPPEAQGALAATYTLGYRIALLLAGAFALFLADHIAWSKIYGGMAALAALTLLATLNAREPALPPRQAKTLQDTLRDGVIGPFRDFFSRFSGITGIALLGFIGMFKLSDQMLGVMALPFYLDCGFSKTDIAMVSKLFGVWIGIAGAFAGGAAVLKFGIRRSLLAGIIMGSLSNLLYLSMALLPMQLPVFVAVICGDNLASGFLGTASVAYLSSLVNQRYTATQYALFSSLVTLPGKLIAGASGFMVASVGYSTFFVVTAVAGIPALLLFFWLSTRIELHDQRTVDDAQDTGDSPSC